MKITFLYIFIFFVASFIFAQIFSRSETIKNLMNRFSNYLTRKAFPEYSETYFNFFGVLRIFFAIVLLIRSWNGWVYLLPDEQFGLEGLVYLVELIAGIFLLIGFLTQYVLIFFIGIAWQVGEKITLSATLGNDVAAMLAFLLVFAQAGRHLSIDSNIIGYFQKSRPWLLYRKDIPNHSAIALFRFIVLFMYSLVCLYSLATHLNESAWMTGLVGPLLLTSSYMSPFYETFRLIFESSPNAVLLSRISLYVMIAWYACIVPFVLIGGLFRAFIIGWGLLFFILSTFFLGLGSLGEIEIIMWLALFWPANWGLRGSKEIKIYYDDKCSLCDKTLQFFCMVDIFNRIETKPLSKHFTSLEKLGVSHEEALNDLYAVDVNNNKIAFGYNMYFFLSTKIFLLFPLFPLFLLGYLLKIGPSIYSFIAKRRRSLFGVCQIPSPQTTHHIKTTSSGSTNMEKGFICHVLLLGFIYLITIPTPFLFENPIKKLIPYIFPATAHVYGITPISVFNTQDLLMSSTWFTIEDSEGKLLPVFNYDGSRGFIHDSDRVYFGKSLYFRRLAIGTNGCIFDRHKDKITYLAKVAMNNAVFNHDSMQIKYIQYYQALPDLNTLKNKNILIMGAIEKTCEIEFQIDNYSM